jgi:hypothetical protein
MHIQVLHSLTQCIFHLYKNSWVDEHLPLYYDCPDLTQQVYWQKEGRLPSAPDQ